VVNAFQFKAMTGHSLYEIERNALEHAEKNLSTHGLKFIFNTYFDYNKHSLSPAA
jgi:hypothetical protein